MFANHDCTKLFDTNCSMKKNITIVLLLMCASFCFAQRKNNNNQKQQITNVDNKRKTKQEAARKREEAKPSEQARQEQCRKEGQERERQARIEQQRREQARRELEECDRRNALHWDEYQNSLCFNGQTYNMVLVKGGNFLMGATSEQGGDAFDAEKTVHKVTLNSYYIGKYEVTQELWQTVMSENPSYFKGNRKPVEMVSWNDCQAFISKLNSLTGKRFRLPTEAEWEFASRGGTMNRGYKYSGSNTLNDVAWFYDNSGNTTHDVGTKSPNELGIHDMSGNVMEWCQDWIEAYSSNSQINPIGQNCGVYERVNRGGSMNSYAISCRSSCRYCYEPETRYANLGFRLVLSD